MASSSSPSTACPNSQGEQQLTVEELDRCWAANARGSVLLARARLDVREPRLELRADARVCVQSSSIMQPGASREVRMASDVVKSRRFLASARAPIAPKRAAPTKSIHQRKRARGNASPCREPNLDGSGGAITQPVIDEASTGPHMTNYPPGHYEATMGIPDEVALNMLESKPPVSV